MPPFDFPANWDSLASAYNFNSTTELYEYYLDDVIHISMVDQLREEFPFTKLFSLPTSWATFNLYEMKIDDLLVYEIDMFGLHETSIFTDLKRPSRK